jgi:hypothetical protein
MAYLVTRNKKSGYVSFVEKRRVPVAGNKTSIRNVDYVCGLGVMTQEEFEEFRGWAHGITCQETRKASVLACPKVIKKETEIRAKVAAEQQKTTTVKRAKRAKIVKNKYTPEEREAERERFRTEYEAKKGIKAEKTRETVYDGIRFTGRKSITEKRLILNERITELDHRIANSKADIRAWQKGRAGGMKVAEANRLISEYEEIRKTLKKQRAGLRR